MKRLFFLLVLSIAATTSFAQFSDTTALNNFVRDTIKDRRPDKVTAAQIQKGMLGISKFVKPNAVTYNLYTQDDTLTGHRLVSLADKQLMFSGSREVAPGMPIKNYFALADSVEGFHYNVLKSEWYSGATLQQGVSMVQSAFGTTFLNYSTGDPINPTLTVKFDPLAFDARIKESTYESGVYSNKQQSNMFNNEGNKTAQFSTDVDLTSATEPFAQIFVSKNFTDINALNITNFYGDSTTASKPWSFFGGAKFYNLTGGTALKNLAIDANKNLIAVNPSNSFYTATGTANFSVSTQYNYYDLPTATANRTVTIAAASSGNKGEQYVFINRNAAAASFHYSFSGNVEYADGTTFTQLPDAKAITIVSTGSKWIVISEK